MKTKIVCAFPAMGKSYYHKEHPDTTLDSDSSDYSWIIFDDGKRMRNSKFPSNYITHIKEQYQSGKYEYIFVSTHKEVRDGLIEAKLPFILIVPSLSMKDEILKRMHDRNSPDVLIKVIEENYDAFINDILNHDLDEEASSLITLRIVEENHIREKYVSDVLEVLEEKASD